MYYLKHLWSKVAHNNPVRLVLDGLARLGLRIAPSYLMVEKSTPDAMNLKTGLEQYAFGLLGPEDMKTIAALPLRPFTEKDLLDRLRAGCICVGVKHAGELVAFSWANPTESRFAGRRFVLKDDEAYLFDSFAFVDYRGKGLIPATRRLIYRELAKLGKTRFYSYTDCFNKSSLRFKEKLGAKKVRLCLSIKLLNRYTVALTLKRFPETQDGESALRI